MFFFISFFCCYFVFLTKVTKIMSDEKLIRHCFVRKGIIKVKKKKIDWLHLISVSCPIVTILGNSRRFIYSIELCLVVFTAAILLIQRNLRSNVEHNYNMLPYFRFKVGLLSKTFFFFLPFVYQRLDISSWKFELFMVLDHEVCPFAYLTLYIGAARYFCIIYNGVLKFMT